MKRAFSLLELVVIIVIMGIITMISSSIIIDLYQDYVRTEILNSLNEKSTNAIMILEKRLSQRIPHSLGIILGSNNIQNLPNSPQKHKNYIWIGKSYEAFLGINKNKIGYSSIIDINSTDTNSTLRTIFTPKSDLNITNEIISELSFKKFGFNKTEHEPALFFSQNNSDIQMFYSHQEPKYSVVVKQKNATIFQLKPNEHLPNNTLYEHYFLAHSAYALMLDKTDIKNVKLMLYYNFQPWQNQSYHDGKNAILMEHVSVFEMYKKNNLLHVKLCLQSNDALIEKLTLCKMAILP